MQINLRPVMALLAVFALSLPVTSFAKDVKGSKDHPLVTRYEGAQIVKYSRDKFDEYTLALGKYANRKFEKEQTVEGTVTKILYQIDKSRTTLEVYKNYETALKNAGFEILYSCSDAKCGGLDFSYAIHGGKFGGSPEKQRYLAAKLTRPGGTAYVSLYVKKAYEIGGPMKNTVYASLDVIDVAAMESGKVTVDASAIGKGLDTNGHIAIYGIYFDSGSDKLKPKSEAALSEIAKLLKARPKLKLLVVGHTDNQGTMKYNMDLSRRRAAAVVAALAKEHGIAKSRLAPAGVGYLTPVASNRADQGRALNRRVELVEG